MWSNDICSILYKIILNNHDEILKNRKGNDAFNSSNVVQGLESRIWMRIMLNMKLINMKLINKWIVMV